jgi:hypothetical protein
LPPFQQRITASPGLVPLEREHAACQREEKEFPFRYKTPKNVLEAQNYVWTNVNDRDAYLLVYSSEDVRTYLEDILSAMKLPLRISAEIAMKQIRPDQCVLILDQLVGVVEVKKLGAEPASSILLQQHCSENCSTRCNWWRVYTEWDLFAEF